MKVRYASPFPMSSLYLMSVYSSHCTTCTVCPEGGYSIAAENVGNEVFIQLTQDDQ